MRTVTITATITVRRPNATVQEARADAAVQAKLQAILEDDMQDRARRIAAVLNKDEGRL